jgi:L-arabinose isomerase
MTQVLYAHMNNKKIKIKKERIEIAVVAVYCGTYDAVFMCI